MTVLAMVIVPTVLFLLGFPVYITLLAAVCVTVVIVMDISPLVIHQTMFGGLNYFAFLAVPFFVFAGDLMARSGIADRLVNWIQLITGSVRGSLPMTVIGASTMMGAVSGSSPATVAAVGQIMYRKLTQVGYDRNFSLGLITSSGSIAIVIPPSIALILYGSAAEESISKLFIAGVVPGIMLAVLCAVYIFWRSTGQYSQIERSGITFFRATIDASGALALPVLVLIAIFSGWVSPTEAGGFACLAAIILARFVYRSMTWLEIVDCAAESTRITAQILIIVATAAAFSWLLTVQGVPQQLVAWIAEIGVEKWSYMLSVNLLLLFLGCLIDPASAILILTPILLPLAESFGIDPIHFGIIMTVNLSIGMFTPPFGLNIFVAQSTTGESIGRIYLGVMPFVGVYLVGLILVVISPSISLWMLDW